MTMRLERDFESIFAGAPVMAILRGYGVERTVDVARRAWANGIDVVEVPLQSPRDLEALRALVAAKDDERQVVGAGTITTTQLVADAAAAGAEFTVSPGFDGDVIRASLAAGLATLPGVGSATDVQRALALGLTWVKAFPAAALGAPWIRMMKGPFPSVQFVATGGIDAGNTEDFLNSGARAVAVGSALSDPQQLRKLARVIASGQRESR